MLRLYQLLSKRGAKGFTMVELLVVMGILTILMGIGINTYALAQKKARDARRKADLKQIQTALELYRQDNGQYPLPNNCLQSENCYGYSTNTTSAARGYNTTKGWIIDLEPNYMSKLPVDPRNNADKPWGPGNSTTSSNYSYAYGNISSNFLNYDLVTNLEDPGDPETCEKKDYQFNLPPAIGGSWCRKSDGTLGRYASTLYVLHAP